MTKTTTLIKHRYKPVSEFDEVTLASKREYWRTKKREQRARLSKARKKVRAPITEVCKPVCTDGHVSQKSNREFSPASLNSDGSYQSTVAQNQTKGVVIYKKMTNEESNMDASVDKQNGGPLTKGLPLPAACIKVHTNSITPQQTQNRSSAINGNLLSISASKLAPKCSKQASQIKCRVTPSAKSSAFVECKFDNDQRIRARTNTTSNAVASGPLCSMVVCKTAEMAMTEEERVAKRRENWRIKKREQRAKRAEKLKINREKMQWFEKGRQETGRFSRAAPAHSLSSVNTMALRKGKQRNSVMSVDPRLSAGKPLNYGVSVEKVKLSQSPYTPQSVALKLAERQRLLAKNLSSVSGYSRNQIQTLKQNHIAISSAVSMQPLRSTQAIGQSRIPQQKFVRIQRMKVLPQGNETAEERLAKQREYWRIKKREQRAKRSLALKGRLKDRDAFNWRAKRYQFIMEQIRKTPTGLQKMPQSNKNTLLDNPNYGNHFIKGDGTVNMSISQTTAEKVSPAISSTLSVVKSSSDSPMAQKLIQIRDRPVLHSIPNSTNLSANQRRTRRSTFKDITACAPVVVSKLASDTKDAKIPLRSSEATQTEQLVPVYRTTFKEELESCDSCSAVTPGLELTSCDSTKQEQMYPSIAMVCSLTEQNQTVNIKEINSAPPPPENNGEAEPCSTNESQSTTLLVVASMKKLLEESLSSVGESNGTSVDKDVLLPCKTEGESFPQEEKEMDRKAELAQPQEFPTDTYSSVVAIQSPSPCHSPLQMHDFSSDSPDLSCRDALLQPSCTASCLNKSPGDERCELPVAACVTPLHSGNSVLSGKTSGPQWNIPPQVHGFQQLNENSELQKKREYWRVMKRQQRARKAKEMEKGKDALPPFQRKYGSSQVNHLPVAQKINHISLENPVILPNVTSRPARPVLSPAALSNQQPSNETRQLLCEVQKGKTKCSEVCQVNKRQLQCRGNVLSSATRPGTMTSMLTNHVKLSDSRIQTRGSSMSKFNRTPSQLKITPNQELELDEATQRKRMHWRIKKQEQRARKAAREKELKHQTTFNQSRHSWSNNITDVVQSIPPERLDYMPADECQTMPVKDEAETCYLPDDDCLDEPLSEDKWRSIYLMDFDPVNQLLVCMVCGEQQYTFSVEEVRAHIEETHPGTLSLEKAERQRILEAWDEQVAVRERFFTNQLWQNSSVIKEQSSRHTAEIEVILGQDDKADQLK